MKIKYSVNASKRSRKFRDIKFVIIHYTGMQSKIVSIKRLLSPKHKVSCHYLIDRSGGLLKMVDENKIAWHSGKSKWKNFKNLNKNSIGIELVNKGHKFGYENFTKSQINSLVKLCLLLKKKYKIDQSNFLGHSDVAPLRKIDPGEKFPWKYLKRKKLGIWYSKNKKKIDIKEIRNLENLFFSNLFKIGYRYFNKNKRNKKDFLIVEAFQRKFLPKKITGIVDKKTYIISHFLANN